MSFFYYPIEHIPVIILIMLVSFSVHEFAHAWTAWKFGDDTAYREGRVTLNPLVHLDWVGMLFLLIGGFGWAKPVPVRRSRFKKPRMMNIIVTAAGPISNLILAFLMLLCMDVLNAMHIVTAYEISEQMFTFIGYWLSINLTLLLFNLIPLPPLDGYRIVEEFLPLRIRIRIQEMAQWTTFLFLLLIFLPPLRAITIGPLLGLGNPILHNMVWVLDKVFGSAGGSIFHGL